MCGIVGVFGQIGVKEETVFKQLLEVDSLRGRHSTGVIKVNSNGVVETRKKAVDGMDFVKLESKWIGQGTNKVLIGHNRWATKGAINDFNAHPFTHDHIHGVHNGTLTTQVGLKDHTTFEVDSDNIFYDIANGSIENTVSNLRGAFAIAMYDDKEKSVNIFRNSQRELSMATLNGGRTIVIASEFMMLEWILMRNGYHGKDGTPEYDIVEFIDTYKNIKLLPFAKGKKNHIAPSISATLTIGKLEAPKVCLATAKKPEKALKDYGVNSSTVYPARLISEAPPANAGNVGEIMYVFELLCPPYEKTSAIVYNNKTKEEIRNKVDGDMLVGVKLNIPYGKRSTTFASYTCDIKQINDNIKKLIVEKPPVKK